ncbi:MAG: ATP-grasp domain-containing protein [Lysobacterales bacterium]|nr:MAG: ATP-grasp domain-containing protein [Xanthomonadales bacterium]
MLESVLIANRGEIACRIIRTARRLGLRTVAVHSSADRGALHTRLADQSIEIGPAEARSSYLDVARILAAARESGAAAIHPGYGFLSENAAFARACAEAGVVFVGPPADAIERMGSKSGARQLMAAAGVPVLPGYDGEDQSDESLATEARRLGFPLLVKPTAGGGGKGMRIVRSAAELAEALAGARREALKAFGDARLLLERFVEKGRHVEIQVFGDTHGGAVHLYERDCSLQRRHQKVIEEAPAPRLDEATRVRMGTAAVAAARAVDYVGAGTVEFLYDGREFYFLEMNTRLQVEHPVTELVTGLDLVEWQLRIASGEPLPLAQEQVPRRGHAVEARLYAEDPERGFLPSTGRLERVRWPTELPHVRVDTGVRTGDEVSIHYDPMLAKVIAWGSDRLAAIDRLREALAATAIDGVRTNTRFLWEILGDEAVRAGDVSTRLLEQALQPVGGTPAERTEAWLVAAALGLATGGRSKPRGMAPVTAWGDGGGFRVNAPATLRLPLRLDEERRWLRLTPAGSDLAVELDGRTHLLQDVEVADERITGRIDGRRFAARYEPADHGFTVRRHCLRFEFAEDVGAEVHVPAEREGHVRSPMPGVVLDVRVRAGDSVEGGAVLAVLEAMKMEHSLTAPWPARVASVVVSPGDRVEEGAELVVLEPRTESSLRQPTGNK